MCSWLLNHTNITLLTCHNCFYAASGRPPSTVGGIHVTVVCRGWRQAVHLTTQTGESLVVRLCWKAEQLLNKQDVAVSSYYTGPLKPYRRAGNCFGKGDLWCGRHWDKKKTKNRSFTWKVLIFSQQQPQKQQQCLPVMACFMVVHTTDVNWNTFKVTWYICPGLKPWISLCVLGATCITTTGAILVEFTTLKSSK